MNSVMTCCKRRALQSIGQIELDAQLVDHLLDDIQSHELQKKALTAIVNIVDPDGSLNAGEAILLSRAMSRWGLELHQVTRIEVRDAELLCRRSLQRRLRWLKPDCLNSKMTRWTPVTSITRSLAGGRSADRDAAFDSMT